MTDLLSIRMITPYLWPDVIFKFSDNYKDQQECLEVLHGFTKNVIKRHYLKKFRS
jgi:hypothetical protein